MSRVGSSPILIPSGLKVEFNNNTVTVTSNGYSASLLIPSVAKIDIKDSQLLLSGNISSSFAGLYRSILSNMILGVSNKFTVLLEVKGVGYKASFSSPHLTLSLGFSHNIKYKIPDTIMVEVGKSSDILLSSEDKTTLNMIASDICSIKKYNPYKRKGISIKGDYVFVKEMNKK